MIQIDYIKGRKRDDIDGISKYNMEIRRRQEGFVFKNIEYSLGRWNRNADGYMKHFFYPIVVRTSTKRSHIKHIMSQDLAFIPNVINLYPLVITCFDIIPWSYYNIHTISWKLNLKGLRKADQVVTISHFSKQELIDHAHVDENRINVLYCGVDQERFKPMEQTDELRRSFGLGKDDKILLYVGSEEPRKNFSTIIRAFNTLKKQVGNVKLLKAGTASYPGARDWALHEIQSLGLSEDVIFLDSVSEDTLPKIYNIADVFVFPSLYEGFGLPPLEAMACGTPVVCSSTTSLPEVVGDAAVLIDPLNTEQISNEIHTLLSDEDLQTELSRAGRTRAKMFDWDRPAQQMTEIYETLARR